MSEIESLKQIVDAYSTYLSIYKRYLKGEKVAKEFDELYRPIFSKILMPQYMEIMPNIKELIELIRKNNYSSNEIDNLVTDYSIIDYIEFLCGNIYYETFIFELNKIDKQSIKLDHLFVFKYILYVEYIKYSTYNKILQRIETLDPESKYKTSMTKRRDFSIRKINFTMRHLENKYGNSHEDFVNECKQIVSNDFNIQLSNEYFTPNINYMNLCK
jgi:hypothetical protein